MRDLSEVVRKHKAFTPGGDCYASTITVGRVSKLKILSFMSPENVGSNEEGTNVYSRVMS